MKWENTLGEGGKERKGHTVPDCPASDGAKAEKLRIPKVKVWLPRSGRRRVTEG